MTTGYTPPRGRTTARRSSLRHRLAVAVLCAALLAAPGVQADPAPASATASAEADSHAGWPDARDALQARIHALNADGDRAGALDAMEELRALAAQHGDTDLAQLMQVRRIFALHDDSNIGVSIEALNDVLRDLRPDAGVELRQALARTYGNLYFDAGNFELALTHQLEALDLAAKLPDGGAVETLYRIASIAELYVVMDEPEQALSYVERGWALAQPPGLEGNRVSLLAVQAQALVHLGRNDEARAALTQAERLNAPTAPDFDTLRLADLRAMMDLDHGEVEAAQAAVTRLQALAASQDNHFYTLRARLLDGAARIHAGDVEQGNRMMRDALREFERLGQMTALVTGLEREIMALHDQAAWPELVFAMERRHQLRSRLFHQSQARATAELEARHQAHQRDGEIAALNAQVALDRTRLRANLLLLALIASLALLVSGVAAALFMSRRRTRRERDLLAETLRHDPLTGALSRSEFQRRAHERGLRPPPGALLMLDLDNFKAINDTHGHEAGDRVLRAVVSRLRGLMAPEDAVFRWGGDEFMLLLGTRPADALRRTAVDMLAAVTGVPLPWQEAAIALTLSGGLVHRPAAATPADIDTLMRWADAALYAAKRAGRDRILEIRLTELGQRSLAGHAPAGAAHLRAWERAGYLALHVLRGGPEAAAGAARPAD